MCSTPRSAAFRSRSQPALRGYGSHDTHVIEINLFILRVRARSRYFAISRDVRYFFLHAPPSSIPGNYEFILLKGQKTDLCRQEKTWQANKELRRLCRVGILPGKILYKRMVHYEYIIKHRIHCVCPCVAELKSVSLWLSIISATFACLASYSHGMHVFHCIYICVTKSAPFNTCRSSMQIIVYIL